MIADGLGCHVNVPRGRTRGLKYISTLSTGLWLSSDHDIVLLSIDQIYKISHMIRSKMGRIKHIVLINPIDLSVYADVSYGSKPNLLFCLSISQLRQSVAGANNLVR